jgi:hypothetical protein
MKSVTNTQRSASGRRALYSFNFKSIVCRSFFRSPTSASSFRLDCNMIGFSFASVWSILSSSISSLLNSSCLYSSRRACRKPNLRYNMKFSSLSRNAARRGYPSAQFKTSGYDSLMSAPLPHSSFKNRYRATYVFSAMSLLD